MTVDQLRERLEASGIPVTILNYVREDHVARALGVNKRTLQRHRSEGHGPEPTKFGTRTFYSLEGIAAYITRQTAARNDNDDKRASKK